MKKLLIAAAATCLPGLALAEGATGIATLGYGYNKISDYDADYDALTLDARGQALIGEDFTLNGRLSVLNDSGEGSEATFTSLGANGAYSFGGPFSLGGYYEYGGLSGDLEFTLNSYGLTGGYDFGTGKAQAFYGLSDSSDLPSEIDIDDYGFGATIQPDARVSLAGSFIRTDISGYGADADLTTLGLAGAFAVSPAMSAFAGFTRLSGSVEDFDIGDASVFGLGVNYFLQPGGASLSAEYQRASAEDADMDTLRIGLTIPFGSTPGSALPKNSVADAVFNPTHNALTQSYSVAD